MTDLPILAEDPSFVVINKPPGLVVNRAQSVVGETVQGWAESRYHFQGGGDFVARSGIVHRIDKETSGCLLVAKTESAFTKLQAQFKERSVKKAYLAVAHGHLVPAEGDIRAPVGRLPWNRERFGILPGGKEAVTRYVVRNNFDRNGQQLAFIELHPETGRTHQIRVHLKYINHPIVGDWQYAGRKTARADRIWAPRVMLHAWKISFLHPETGSEVAIEAPIPDDMKMILP